jgi:hypothetical protein
MKSSAYNLPRIYFYIYFSYSHPPGTNYYSISQLSDWSRPLNVRAMIYHNPGLLILKAVNYFPMLIFVVVVNSL